MEDKNKQTNKQSEHTKTKVFINLQFLQKMGRQKPFLDEATLHSLVYKRIVP